MHALPYSPLFHPAGDRWDYKHLFFFRSILRNVTLLFALPAPQTRRRPRGCDGRLSLLPYYFTGPLFHLPGPLQKKGNA